jgi:hypothetical protein
MWSIPSAIGNDAQMAKSMSIVFPESAFYRSIISATGLLYAQSTQHEQERPKCMQAKRGHSEWCNDDTLDRRGAHVGAQTDNGGSRSWGPAPSLRPTSGLPIHRVQIGAACHPG